MPSRKPSRSARSATTKSRSRVPHARNAPKAAGRARRADRSRPQGRGKANGAADGTGMTWGESGSGQEVPMRTVTPNLVPTDCAAALDWYAKTFGARELARMPGPGGKVMHAMMRIGDTVVMLSDNFGPPNQPDAAACAFLHIHDKGIQRFWDRAVADGATVVLPLANQFWGDKYGQLRDPFGITWSFGWPAKMTQAEKDRLERAAMQEMSAQAAR